MSDQLPPLPASQRVFIDNDPAFDADQMHAYARAAQAMAYERAAEECMKRTRVQCPGDLYAVGYADASNDCAAVIIALAAKE